MNQPASLPFVVQMSPVTVKGRAGLMIGGAGLNCKVHSGGRWLLLPDFGLLAAREEGGWKARQGTGRPDRGSERRR